MLNIKVNNLTKNLNNSTFQSNNDEEMTPYNTNRGRSHTTSHYQKKGKYYNKYALNQFNDSYNADQFSDHNQSNTLKRSDSNNISHISKHSESNYLSHNNTKRSESNYESNYNHGHEIETALSNSVNAQHNQNVSPVYHISE